MAKRSIHTCDKLTPPGPLIPIKKLIELRKTVGYIEDRSIIINLRNFLLTSEDERYMNPGFGSRIRSYLFEQLTEKTYDNIKQDIEAVITQNFPTVVIDEVLVEGDLENRTFRITLKVRANTYVRIEKSEPIYLTIYPSEEEYPILK